MLSTCHHGNCSDEHQNIHVGHTSNKIPQNTFHHFFVEGYCHDIEWSNARVISSWAFILVLPL